MKTKRQCQLLCFLVPCKKPSLWHHSWSPLDDIYSLATAMLHPRHPAPFFVLHGIVASTEHAFEITARDASDPKNIHQAHPFSEKRKLENSFPHVLLQVLMTDDNVGFWHPAQMLLFDAVLKHVLTSSKILSTRRCVSANHARSKEHWCNQRHMKDGFRRFMFHGP